MIELFHASGVQCAPFAVPRGSRCLSGSHHTQSFLSWLVASGSRDRRTGWDISKWGTVELHDGVSVGDGGSDPLSRKHDGCVTCSVHPVDVATVRFLKARDASLPRFCCIHRTGMDRFWERSLCKWSLNGGAQGLMLLLNAYIL